MVRGVHQWGTVGSFFPLFNLNSNKENDGTFGPSLFVENGAGAGKAHSSAKD